MPRLWTDAIETHRRDVRDAVLDAAAAIASEQGVLGVNMSRIAERTGISRATLYNYFPDVESVLRGWHERHVARHLDYVTAVADKAPDADRLRAVVDALAVIRFESGRHHPGVSALLHSAEHMTAAHDRLHHLLRDVVAQAAERGDVRRDTAPDELAVFCAHAVTAAASLPTRAAVRRLVGLTLAALRPA